MNGYCQFEIKGEKVFLKFGMISNQRFIEKARKFELFQSDEDGNQIYNILGLTHIIYSGYVNNCVIKEQVEKYSFEEFYDLIEDDFFVGKLRDDVTNAILEFSESRFIKRLVDKTQSEEETEKKNQKKKRVKKTTGTK